jgi:tetratricopeptide (TPR) repeat protein
MSVIPPYDSRLSGATSGTRSSSRRARNCLAPSLCGPLALALVLFPGFCRGQGTASNSPPTSASLVESTNLQQLLRTCAQIQEQLRATQLAIERNHEDTETVAAQNAGVVSNGLQVLETAIVKQRAQDWQAMQDSNKVMFIALGTFGVLGVLTMCLLLYFQRRMTNGLAEISALLPSAWGLAPGSAAAAIGPAQQSRLRLLGAMEHLDKRIRELREAISPGGNGDSGGPATEPDPGSPAAGSDSPGADEPARISHLLTHAHSLMKSENPEAALACFDGVLALNPNHTEALVKKGAALERLHKLNEAIECYDRAIALDGSLTTAYLHKGGLCNRLERFREALQCYEKALRTQDQRGS